MYEGGEEERDNVMSTSYNKITAKTAHPDGPHDHDHDHHDVEAHTECDDEDGEKGSKASEKPTAATTTADDDDEEEDVLGLRNALIWLTISTVFIAILSDAISATIEAAASDMGMSKVFIAAILLPIVGNAAEHAGAVMFAMKGKLDLSLGVAIGSSTQIALCVLPLLVLIGWMGGYDLSMNFGGFEAATLFLTVISVTFAIKDGRSDWLVGLTLIAAYIVIALGFWAHENDQLDLQL